MNVFAIRHLPTAWNESNQIQGTKNIDILPVSESLNKLVLQNKKRLELASNNKSNVILCSGLNRTHQTAEIYQINSYEVEPLLNELNFGQFEGAQKEVFIKEVGEDWFENPYSLVLGEPLKCLFNRVEKTIKKYNSFNNVIIFGHGAWIRAMVAIYKFKDMSMMNKVNISNNQLIEIKI